MPRHFTCIDRPGCRTCVSSWSCGFALGMVRDPYGSDMALTGMNAAEAALLASSVPVVCPLAAAMRRTQEYRVA
jgi:hypothetical protein